MRARTNAALYRNWFTDIQELSTAVYVDAQGVTRSTGVNRNAAKAKILGADFQVQLIPTDSIELNFAYNYMMAKYVSFNTTDALTLRPVDLSNRGFAFAPRHAGNGTLKFHLPVDPALGRASVQATYSYMGKMSATPDGAPLIEASRKQLDFRADWNDVGGYPIDIAFFVNNVTNSDYTVSSFNSYAVLGLTLWTYTDPRTFGGQIRYRFGS
jgi:iron complex outermembrane receptor protein